MIRCINCFNKATAKTKGGTPLCSNCHENNPGLYKLITQNEKYFDILKRMVNPSPTRSEMLAVMEMAKVMVAEKERK